MRNKLHVATVATATKRVNPPSETIIELEVLVVLREWYRERAAGNRAEARQKGREEGHQRGYKEGFEAGRKAEREAQAVSSGNSSDKNEKP